MWNLLPFSIREKLEAPNRYEVRREIKNILKKIGGEKVSVLDVGAGDCFAEDFFIGNEYVAMDVIKNSASKRELDIMGSIENAPFKNETFDMILCLEVLEHIRNYQLALKEIYRILKEKKVLLLTIPLMSVGFHNDFYRFTPLAIKKELENAGLKIEKIIPVGGYFRMLGWQISKISYLIKKPKNKFFWPFYYLIKIPIGLIFQIIIPLVLFHLDWLDKDKKETCGYLVVALKLKNENLFDSNRTS